MGLGSSIAALISLAVGAAGTAYSINEQKQASRKMASAQNKAQEVELAINQEQAARERRSQIREARIQRAMVANLGATTGQGSGSAAIVGGQAATAQAGQNIGNINTAMSGATSMGQAQQRMVNAQGEGVGALGQFAGAIGGMGLQLGAQGLSTSIFKD